MENKNLKVFQLSNEKLHELAVEVKQISRDPKFTSVKFSRFLGSLMKDTGHEHLIDQFELIKILVKSEIFERFVTKKL